MRWALCIRVAAMKPFLLLCALIALSATPALTEVRDIGAVDVRSAEQFTTANGAQGKLWVPSNYLDLNGVADDELGRLKRDLGFTGEQVPWPAMSPFPPE